MCSNKRRNIRGKEMLQEEYREQITLLNLGFTKQHQFLDWLYNKCGPFKVQRHIQGKNPTKWHDWMVVRENQYRDTYNHRNIATCEIVFDLDLPKWLDETERTQTLNMTLRRLHNKYNIKPVVLDTGVGYHLHWFSMVLAEKMCAAHNPKEEKRKYAEEILMDVRSDLLKWNHNTMIAIECSPHWKRGDKIKLLKM